MYNCAIKILNLLCNSGYEAYIVGGYPRDKYLNILSNDIDICTNAKIDDIKEIFDNIDLTYSKYGNVILSFEGYKFDVTVFRKDIDSKIIRMINSSDELIEDPLRILRAIRFATILDFKLDEELSSGIIKYGYLIKNLSNTKKKKELDKIMNSKNREYGVYLIKKYGLDVYL